MRRMNTNFARFTFTIERTQMLRAVTGGERSSELCNSHSSENAPPAFAEYTAIYCTSNGLPTTSPSKTTLP